MINCLLELVGKTTLEVAVMPFGARNVLFEEAFSAMCKYILCPECTSPEEIERTNLARLSFVTIYEKLLEFSHQIGEELPAYTPPHE